MEGVRRSSSRLRSLGNQSNGEKSQGTESGSVKTKAEEQHTSAKKSFTSARKERKSPAKVKSKRYPLRSSINGVRVLRSTSEKVNKSSSSVSTTATITPANLHKDKRKRKKRVKRAVKDEYAKIKRHVRYFLHRMDYEQSLIDAYSSEGWRGQSLEKIRPEKELQRAKSEIIRCKLSIRNQFQHFDSLISEGRLEDSLFDSEGQIDSEDIVCAKCGSKQLSTNNDIILCDGVCDRGFHQKCLTPPLLSEDIPPGDEGWLCPACDCKLDCINFINEAQENNLSIEDEWEKIFPEAAAVAAGDAQYDDLGLPSDDSEDDDYAPDGPEVHGQVDEGSNSEESFTSEDPLVPNNGLPSENFGFPSDDSEDDDYDPDKANLEAKSQTDASVSDESDFTSDTDDLTKEYSGSKNGFTSPVQNHLYSEVQSGYGRSAGDTQGTNTEFHSSVVPNVGQENIVLVSNRRERECLDYKKLYDDAYGDASSDSSDDEEWADKDTTNEVKNHAMKKCSSTEPSENICPVENQRSLRRVEDESSAGAADPKLHQSEHSVENKSQNTKRNCRKLPKSDQSKGSVLLGFDENKNSPSAKKHFSQTVAQALQESFKESQYPSRDRKAQLANELGITSQQVAKWFDNARHSFRVSTKESSQAENDPKSVMTPDDTPLSSPVRKSSQSTPASAKGISSDAKTPARIDTPLISPVGRSCKGLPVSAKSINSDAKTLASTMMEPDNLVSPQKNSNRDQQSALAEAAADVVVSSNGHKAKETAFSSMDRQKLVLRELRKRRRGM